MRQVKNTKLYKASVSLLGLIFLVNFSFCLMPLTVSAQIPNGPKEIIPEVFQEEIAFSEENSCENTGHDYKTIKTETREAQTDQRDNTPDKNTVLPCCLDHNKVTKIDNAPKPEINNLVFKAASENNLSDGAALIQSSSYIQPLDLPPPKADILFSVYKKE